MDKQAIATMVLGSAIVEWLADEALPDSEPATLYGELCQRLRGVGVPVLRGQVARKPETHLFSTEACSIALSCGLIANTN